MEFALHKLSQTTVGLTL